MPFLLICNPKYGNHQAPRELAEKLINPLELKSLSNWIPSLYVDQMTNSRTIDSFLNVYSGRQVAMVYYGRPRSNGVQAKIDAANVKHHIFMPNSVERSYIRKIRASRRVIITDPYRRRRNVEYKGRTEFFTELNTLNKTSVGFGDFSIVGDYYAEGGGAAKAVALHHIHFTGRNIYSLHISHFVSDQTETTANQAGKTIQAVNHLVRSLSRLYPNNTRACHAYREMSESKEYHGLGYMKRLGIMHHLEVMLHPNGLA